MLSCLLMYWKRQSATIELDSIIPTEQIVVIKSSDRFRMIKKFMKINHDPHKIFDGLDTAIQCGKVQVINT